MIDLNSMTLSELKDLAKENNIQNISKSDEVVDIVDKINSNVPRYKELKTGLSESSKLVDDIVLKKYLYNLLKKKMFQI